MEKVTHHTSRYGLIAATIGGYIAFLYIDLFRIGLPRLCDALKLGCIAMCFVITLANKTERGRLLSLAMLLSIAADYMLLYTAAAVSGVVCFCCVQLLHIRRFRPQISWHCLWATLAVVLALLADSISFHLFNTLYAVGVVYAALITIAFICACKWERPLVGVGMLLFVICDLNVALYNILPTGAGNFAYIFMWAVYVPAQLILSLDWPQVF